MRAASPELKEEFGACFEAIMGAVINDGGKIDRRLEDAREMHVLGRGRRPARQDARDDHQAPGADLLGVPGEGGRPPRILCACPDDDGEARFDQMLDALHALFVGQQRPIAHRAAVDHGRHSGSRSGLRPLRVSAPKSGVRSGLQGVISAGITPANTLSHGYFLPFFADRVRLGECQESATGGRSDLARIAGGNSGIGTISAPMEPRGERGRDFLDALGRPFLGEELFDRIDDMVFFLKDRNARYVAVNEALVRRCGLPGKADLVGRTAREVFPPLLGDRFETSGTSAFCARAFRSMDDWSCISIPRGGRDGA